MFTEQYLSFSHGSKIEFASDIIDDVEFPLKLLPLSTLSSLAISWLYISVKYSYGKSHNLANAIAVLKYQMPYRSNYTHVHVHWIRHILNQCLNTI